MKRMFLIGAAWSGASSWIEQALNLTIFIVIARIIGTEQFGLAGMAMAFLLLSEVLIRETLTEQIIQRPNLEDGFLEAVWTLLMAAGFVTALILCGLAPVAAHFYQEPSVTWLLIATTPVILMISCYGVPAALLRRRLAFDILGVQAVLGAVAGGIVGIGIALMGYGAWALVGQRLAMTFVNFLISIFAAKWVPQQIPRLPHFKLISGLGPRVAIIKVATSITNQTPTIALGVFVGANAVAIYSLSLRVVEVLATLFVSPLKAVTQSVVAEMQRRGEGSGDFILEVSQIVALLSCASLAGLAVVGDPAVPIVFGEEWIGSIYVVPFICLAGCVNAVTGMQESYLMALGRMKRWVRVVIVETAVGVALILLASPYGPVWTAVAFSARAMLFLPFRTALVLEPEAIPVKKYVRWVIVVPSILALAMASFVWLWRYLTFGQIPDLAFLGLGILIGLAAYGAMLVTLTPTILSRAKLFVQAARAEG